MKKNPEDNGILASYTTIAAVYPQSESNIMRIAS